MTADGASDISATQAQSQAYLTTALTDGTIVPHDVV
jgi:hypothetical protein